MQYPEVIGFGEKWAKHQQSYFVMKAHFSDHVGVAEFHLHYQFLFKI